MNITLLPETNKFVQSKGTRCGYNRMRAYIHALIVKSSAVRNKNW